MKKYLVLLVLTGAIAIGYQNCSGGFAPNTEGSQFLSSGSGLTGFILDTAMGAIPQCPVGYTVADFEAHSTCSNSGTNGACVEARCIGGAATNSGYIVSDIIFVNSNPATPAACPGGYHLPSDIGGTIAITENYTGTSNWTYICVQYQTAGSQTTQITNFYTSATACNSGDTSFSGYKWVGDALVATFYCLTK
jgi:hypothetical protein